MWIACRLSHCKQHQRVPHATIRFGLRQNSRQMEQQFFSFSLVLFIDGANDDDDRCDHFREQKNIEEKSPFNSNWQR